MKTLTLRLILAYVFGLMALTGAATASQPEWDGRYEGVNCGTAEQCGQTAATLAPSKALPYYASACVKGLPGACLNVGMSYSALGAAWSGTPKKLKKAIEWYQRGCDLEAEPNNCQQAIEINLRLGDLTAAKTWLKKFCKGDEHGCEISSSPMGQPKRDAAILNLFKSSCKDGFASACNILAKRGQKE